MLSYEAVQNLDRIEQNLLVLTEKLVEIARSSDTVGQCMVVWKSGISYLE